MPSEDVLGLRRNAFVMGAVEYEMNKSDSWGRQLAPLSSAAILPYCSHDKPGQRKALIFL